MFTGHTLKVIIGFCGMILLGLLSLIAIDGLDQKQQADVKVEQNVSGAVVLPPLKK